MATTAFVTNTAINGPFNTLLTTNTAINGPFNTLLNLGLATNPGMTTDILSSQIPPALPDPPFALPQLPLIESLESLDYWYVEDSSGQQNRLPSSLRPVPGAFFPERDSVAYRAPGGDLYNGPLDKILSYYGDKKPTAQHLTLINAYISNNTLEGALTMQQLQAFKTIMRNAVKLVWKKGIDTLEWPLKKGHSSIVDESIITPVFTKFNCRFAVKKIRPRKPLLLLGSYVEQGAGSRFQFQQDIVDYATLFIPAIHEGKIAIVTIKNSSLSVWGIKNTPNGWVKLGEEPNYVSFIFNVDFNNGSLTEVVPNFYKINTNLPFDPFQPMSHFVNLIILPRKELINSISINFVHDLNNSSGNPNIFGNTITANSDKIALMMTTVFGSASPLNVAETPVNDITFKSVTFTGGTVNFAILAVVPKLLENVIFSYSTATTYSAFNLYVELGF
jgi:hypothetical protein